MKVDFIVLLSDPLPLKGIGSPSLKGSPEIICPQAKARADVCWVFTCWGPFPRDGVGRSTLPVTLNWRSKALPRSQLLNALQGTGPLPPSSNCTYCYSLGVGIGGQSEAGPCVGPGLSKGKLGAGGGAATCTPTLGNTCPWCCVRDPHVSSASLHNAGQEKSLQDAPPRKKLYSFSFPLSQLPTLTLFGTIRLPRGALSAPYPSCFHQSPNNYRLHPTSGPFLP